MSKPDEKRLWDVLGRPPPGVPAGDRAILEGDVETITMSPKQYELLGVEVLTRGRTTDGRLFLVLENHMKYGNDDWYAVDVVVLTKEQEADMVANRQPETGDEQ